MRNQTVLFLCLFLVGCASVTFKDGSREVTYSSAFKDVKGLTFNSQENSVTVTVESAQSDTQALSGAVQKLADMAVKAR
jgi:uncharacterized protein YceK